MTKIPTVRERYEEKFGWAGSSGTFTGIRDEEIVEFITAEREAGAKDERARITKNLSELRQTTLNGEVFISEESIKGEVDNWSKYKIVTPPTK